MTEPADGRHPQRDLERRIARKEQRKLWARRHRHERVWFGLGMFGVVGWSVAIPALLGLAAGLWIDATFPGRFSWTLMLLVGGVALGCWNAWYWVSREQARIDRETDAPPPDERSGR